MTGRSPPGPGYSPKGGAAKASPAKPSIPNAMRGTNAACCDIDLLFADDTEEGAATGLLALMTGISEEYWCAGWMCGLEYSLWERSRGSPSSYGQGFVTKHQCDLLRLLSEEAGGWWFWDEKAGNARFARNADWIEHLDGIAAAQGIEAQRATTENTGVVGDESPVRKDAPESPSDA